MPPADRLGIAALALAVGLAVTSAAALAADAGDQATPASPPAAVATGPMSQAQLADRLRADGYSEIRLTADRPNPHDPHPELNGSGGDPRTTPVQSGWNGTAVKNGQTVNIYWDEAAQRIDARW